MSTDGDWLDDGEEWSDDDSDASDNRIACPECGGEVYDDADQCSHCGHWILDEERDAADQTRVWPHVVRWVAAGLLAAWLGAILVTAIR